MQTDHGLDPVLRRVRTNRNPRKATCGWFWWHLLPSKGAGLRSRFLSRKNFSDRSGRRIKAAFWIGKKRRKNRPACEKHGKSTSLHGAGRLRGFASKPSPALAFRYALFLDRVFRRAGNPFYTRKRVFRILDLCGEKIRRAAARPEREGV